MGARQSYLYIYLNKKDTQYDESGCKVEPKKTVYTGCIDFELVTYAINYNGNTPTSFDIYIYDSKETVSNGYYIFAYCSPRTHQVADKVQVYYSVLAPDKPLVISFVTKSTEPYNCDIDKLKNARWDWAAYITEYLITGDILVNLKEKYKKLNLNKTIEFDVGTKETKDVTSYKQKIDDESYRIIYTPKGGESVLNSKCLFSSDNKFADENIPSEVKSGCKEIPTKEKKNKIDAYSLTSVKGHFFDGIIVYFAKDNGQALDNKDNDNYMALYLEFINLRNKDVCLKRKGKDGCWWAEEKVDYSDNKSLGTVLKSLKDEVNKNDKSTIILDLKASYTGVTVNSGENKQAYMKYTHVFEADSDHNFMFGRKTITIGSGTVSYGKSKNVEVYYLKAKNKEDELPFLIVFISNGQEQQKNKKACYFNNTNKFDDWKEFNGEKPEEFDNKLNEKLKEIEDNLNCANDLILVRLMAHQIFIGEKPKPPDIKETTPPKRPDLEIPGSTTGPPNWWLIIGCSVGGFLLLVALVVGYGIYWYNTTIKLLT